MASSLIAHIPGCPLEEILVTRELDTRPSPPANFQAENEALVALSSELVESPENVLQSLAEAASRLCGAESGGLSIQEVHEGQEVFRWRATSGRLAPFVNGTLPRDFSPCGLVVDTGMTQLMTYPARHYTYVNQLGIPFREVLLAPFFRGRKAIGTVWVTNHERERPFNREDARIVQNLARFASVCSQTLWNLSQVEGLGRQLAEVGSQMDCALQAANIGTWNWDPINDRVYVDSRTADMFDLSWNTANGAPLDVFLAKLHADDRERISSAIEASLVAGENHRVEFRVVTRTGSVHHLRSYGSIHRSAVGTAIRMPGVVLDITHEFDRHAKHAPAEEEVRDFLAERHGTRPGEMNTRLLASIVDSSNDGIVSKDLNGIVTSWNKAAERIFGYTAEEMVGQSITLLFPLDRRQEEAEILKKIGAGESIEHYETTRLRKNGSMVDVDLTISPVRDRTGKIVGASKIVRDVTEVKKSQRALERVKAELALMNRDLERRVAERTASLAHALEQLEDFSYTVSHDLRSPLRAIKGYGDALIEDYGARLDKEGRRYATRMSEAAVQLDRMIMDVLAYSRVSSGRISLSRVDLREIVRTTLAQQPTNGEVAPEIEVGELHAVLGHEPSLSQAVSNLLNNARKFVRPNIPPRIKIWSERVGRTVRFSIEDNGIGIKPEFQSRLFSMFERAPTADAFEGTGVGLAIVRKAIARMSGKVGVDSDGATGSRFWFEIAAAD